MSPLDATSAPELGAIWSKYRHYEAACAECRKIKSEPKAAIYRDETDFITLICKITKAKLHPALQRQSLNNLASRLHDCTFRVWVECVEHNIKRCEDGFDRYDASVGKNKKRGFASVADAATTDHYRESVAFERARLETLRAVLPVHSNYIDDPWDSSFDDLMTMNGTVSSLYSDMWKHIKAGEEENRIRDEQRNAKVRGWMGVAGGGGAIGIGLAIVDHWSDIGPYLGL